jgi:MerR family transcriptional regulator, copper efflux regulator
MWIAEAARAAGVNQQTFRYYERRGLLPSPPRRGVFRAYGDDSVRVVLFIKQAQELGFSLDEVEQLLRLRGVAPQERHRVRAIAERKIADIDTKIARLRAMKRALTRLVASCHRGGTPSCPIIESLSAKPGTRRKQAVHG